MKRWLRFTAAVLAAAFLFALTGCGSSTNSASFTWFVDSIPANLDPQVASGASDVIACENLYGTLVRKDPDGELVPGLCEKWTVSSDGLTYTFTLKDGLTYAAAKGALKMLTKNIASEYGEYNIQCNGIGPGYIATPQTAPLREIQPDGSRHPFDQFIVAKTPAARWGNAEDLGGPAVFLASEASDFVNGLILYVDGGILAYIGKQPG